ncbi:MAG: UPF0147 family protein [Nanoarchaeota archaeon]
MTKIITNQFSGIIEALMELRNDTGVPKNLKTKIAEMLDKLKCCEDNSITVNKLLGELEEISNDINLQPFVRTQLYNISSMLETIA